MINDPELIEIYNENGNRSNYAFWLLEGDDVLQTDDLEFIQDKVNEWSKENQIPAKFVGTENGFDVELTHLCESGKEFASSLFLFLARGCFRKLQKGMAYGPKT